VVVPDTQIRSTVQGRWVTLESDVSTWHELGGAELVVRHLAGVHGVVNKIEVNLCQDRRHSRRD
jgi:osmotically-inducible protein OsmY